MTSGKTLVLWSLGGAGVLLLYSAVQNKHPIEALGGIYKSKTGDASTLPTSGSFPAVPPLPEVGKRFVVDKNGYEVQVPDEYQTNPNSWIPGSRYAV